MLWNSSYTRELNFRVFPPHFNDGEISGDIRVVGDVLYCTGPVVFTFHETVLFQSIHIVGATGVNIIKCDDVSYIVNNVYENPTPIKKLTLILNGGCRNIIYHKSHASLKLRFPQAGRELFPSPGIIWQNAISADGAINPVRGECTAHFNPPAQIYSCNTQMKFYVDGELVHNGANYPDPVTEVRFAAAITHLIYHQNLERKITKQRLHVFPQTICPNYQNEYFRTAGTTTESGFSGTVMFREPNKLTILTVSAPTMLILDNYTYQLQAGTHQCDMWVENIICQNLLSFDHVFKYRSTQHITCGPDYDFRDEFALGETRICNEYFKATGMISADGLCYATNSRDPQPQQGEISVRFHTPTYISQITVTGSGTLRIADRVYFLPVTELSDGVCNNMLVSDFKLIFNGALQNMKFTRNIHAQKNRNLVLEDFRAPPIEFSVTTFDTANHDIYATPNIAGWNNDVYRGRATTDSIFFDVPRFVKYIGIIGHGTIRTDRETFTTPDFGAGGVHRVNLCQKTSFIEITDIAIHEICYATHPRITTQLPVTLRGNRAHVLKIYGPTNAIYNVSQPCEIHGDYDVIWDNELRITNTSAEYHNIILL